MTDAARSSRRFVRWSIAAVTACALMGFAPPLTPRSRACSPLRHRSVCRAGLMRAISATRPSRATPVGPRAAP